MTINREKIIMPTRISPTKILMNPVKVVTYGNLLLITIMLPILLFTVIGYYFSWHKISQYAIVPVTAFISVWLGLLVIGYFGGRNWKVWGRISSFLAWFPALFAFPIGTIMAAWMIYSLFRKPLSGEE